MNRPFTKIATLLLFTTASLSACKKDKDETKSRTALLTEKEWFYVEYGSDNNNDGILSKDEVSIEDCEVDDSYKFNTDGTLLDKENAIRCTSGSDTKTLTWAFQNNESEIILSTGRLIKIKTLNETTFECSSEEIAYPDDSKIITIFKH
jgi:hypothetical protein